MAKPKLDRKTLLRNSLSVFKTMGYNGTSMNDLAKANGLQKGSMYHYIESKESLMLEVLMRSETIMFLRCLIKLLMKHSNHTKG